MTTSPDLTIALISDVFVGPDASTRLRQRLLEARAQGAQLALLPELPLDPWVPATRESRESDAEPPHGPRQQCFAEAAAAAQIAVVGGAIVRNPASGHRENLALVYDADGQFRGSYAKLHLPDEPGFWEPCHYHAGEGAFPLFGVQGTPFGIQICSDINRPQGAHVLAARGARLIAHPRATEPSTFEAWRLVIRATARTAAVWIASVNRPAPELGTPLGGPSLVVDPSGTVVAQSMDPVTVVEVDPTRTDEAAGQYPGYLPVRSDVYATAWAETLAQSHRRPPS